MYCSECGTEVEDGTSYCPDCGTELEVKSTTETENKPTNTDTAACKKCDEEISTEAERCPQCGFEPSDVGILGNFIGLICVILLGIAALLCLAAIVGFLVSGYTIVQLIGAVFFIAALSAGPAVFVYGLYQNADRKPTESVEFLGQEFG